MPEVIVLFSEDNPKWVEADKVAVSEDGFTAKVVAWGYKFEPALIAHNPSDRFVRAHDYVEVEHPTGNWLRVFWWV